MEFSSLLDYDHIYIYLTDKKSNLLLGCYFSILLRVYTCCDYCSVYLLVVF